MNPLDNLIQKLSRLEGSVNSIIGQEVLKNSIFVEALNKKQLDLGVRSDGTNIAPEYEAITVAIKQSKGQPTDRVTLKDTGAFYRGFRTVVFGDRFNIISMDLKERSLIEKYGVNIFGLNEASRQALRTKLIPGVQQQILKFLR